MMKYALLILVVMVACSRPKKVSQSIILGQCYHYDHPTKHPHRPFAEKVNPFYYRALSRKGNRINMEMSYLYRGVWEKDTMHQSEGQLAQQTR